MTGPLKRTTRFQRGRSISNAQSTTAEQTFFGIALPVRGADAVPSEATAPTCVETATKLDRNVLWAAAEFEN